MKTVRIEVFGKVRDVGFRFFAKQLAQMYDLPGTVKYTGDRSLQIEVCGEKDSIDKFIDYCSAGSVGSKIDDILINEITEKDFHSFEIINNV
ncbi:MAG: acylphosphatase [Bacteroidales bacterium]|nr:acylphosphatase [Bacteroidales bacterium]